MFKYENQICQVCQQTFDKDDDIVVCPECGTPHHRHCWHEQGDCVNRHKHAEGFEWKPAVKEVPADSVTCAECGANMPSGTLFCENCGKALAQPQQQASQSYTMPGGGRIEVHQAPPFGAGMPMGMGFDGGSALAGEIDGVAIKDMAAFIGPNAQYYIYKFKRMVADARYKPFNWTAFMFRPLWFLYRKLWKPAVISAILNMVTSIPMLIAFGVEAGTLASSYMFPGIETAMMVGQIVNFAVNVLWGFMAVPMYRKDTVRRMKKIRAESGTDNNLYYSKLMAECGPSKIGTIIIFFFSIYYIISMLFPV